MQHSDWFDGDDAIWVTDADWGKIRSYPNRYDWPVSEFWFDNRYAIAESEFTIHQTNAYAAGTYGFLWGLTGEDIDDGDDGNDSIPSGTCSAQGYINMEKWDNISGPAIDDLKNAADYPDNPSSTTQLTSLEIPSDVAENYGVRVHGFICAPETGEYTFWIAGDDNVELSLSTDDDPANASVIAYHTSWTSVQFWTKFSTQKSIEIALVAGESYYIEAIMKEANGGDNLAVGWRKPSDGTGTEPTEVIPSSALATPCTGAQRLATADEATQPTETMESPSIQFYPNPIQLHQNNTLQVLLGNATFDNPQIIIRDIQGKTYNVKSVSTNGQRASIELGEIPSGMYLIQIRNQGQIFTEKLLITNSLY